jgi:hypothetical protein
VIPPLDQLYQHISRIEGERCPWRSSQSWQGVIATAGRRGGQQARQKIASQPGRLRTAKLTRSASIRALVHLDHCICGVAGTPPRERSVVAGTGPIAAWMSSTSKYQATRRAPPERALWPDQDETAVRPRLPTSARDRWAGVVQATRARRAPLIPRSDVHGAKDSPRPKPQVHFPGLRPLRRRAAVALC